MSILLTPDSCRMGSFVRFIEDGNTRYAVIRARSPRREVDGVVHPPRVYLESPQWALENATVLRGFSFEQLQDVEIITEKEVLSDMYAMVNTNFIYEQRLVRMLTTITNFEKKMQEKS